MEGLVWGGVVLVAARDVLLISVVVFAIAIGFFILHFVFRTMSDGILEANLINDTSPEGQQSLESVKTLTNDFDYFVLVIFIGLCLALIVTGWFVGGYKFFMIFYFIVIVIAVILSAVLSNVWETISAEPTFSYTSTQFPITNHLMDKLPFYISVVGFIGLIVMFAKPGGEYG